MKFLSAGLIATVGMILCLSSPQASDDREPKYTIKEVMKKAHSKNGLLNKVKSGKADADERKELVVLYVALAQNKPRKGNLEDWKTRTGEIVKAAKAAQKDETATKALVKATACAACHKLHK